MSTPESCRYCGVRIAVINYALGPEWMHVTEGASFPTEHKGTAWRYCKITAALPALKQSIPSESRATS